MALTVKSRRAMSPSIVVGLTEGSAPGDSYVSLRAVATSTVNPLASSLTVPNCDGAETLPPSASASSAPKRAAASIVGTVSCTSRSGSPGGLSRSTSRTIPPTR